jgi:threonine dehydrogenase-like Zn-dependent dehydrogenase
LIRAIPGFSGLHKLAQTEAGRRFTDATSFQTAVKVTKPGGTVSNTGYFGEGEFVRIPRVEWGADKTIATGLCPGGRLRMERLLRVLETKRVDPTLMTTHTYNFDEMKRAFEVSDKKLEDVIKPLIVFPG